MIPIDRCKEIAHSWVLAPFLTKQFYGEEMYKYKFICDACSKTKTVEVETEMVRGDTPEDWIPLFCGGHLFSACSRRCHTRLFKQAGLFLSKGSRYPSEIKSKPRLVE